MTQIVFASNKQNQNIANESQITVVRHFSSYTHRSLTHTHWQHLAFVDPIKLNRTPYSHKHKRAHHARIRAIENETKIINTCSKGPHMCKTDWSISICVCAWSNLRHIKIAEWSYRWNWNPTSCQQLEFCRDTENTRQMEEPRNLNEWWRNCTIFFAIILQTASIHFWLLMIFKSFSFIAFNFWVFECLRSLFMFVEFIIVIAIIINYLRSNRALWIENTLCLR